MKRLLCLVCLVFGVSGVGSAAPLDWTQGFATDYEARVAGTNDMWSPGTYTFDSSACGNHGLWECGGDATGDAVFMLVNGDEDKPNSLVWGKALDIGPEMSTFSLWAKNLCCVDRTGRMGPSLEFWFDGFKMADIETDGPGVWSYFTFIPPLFQGTHLFEVRNGSTVYDGNDFGLDFNPSTPTPEPASLIMLSTGFVLAARRLRRSAWRSF